MNATAKDPGSYIPRVIDAELRDRLKAGGAVVIEGPKACGKTASARQVAKSEVLVDVDEEARLAVAVDPSLVLDGATPRLIDEWQIEPAIWNHIRRAVDDRGQPGQFVLTGSAVPADDVVRHTGAGRISRLRMRPMSSFECSVAGGEVSLSAVLAGESVRAADTGITIHQLAHELAVGGWPGTRHLETTAALRAARDYLDEVRRTDIGRVDDRRRDPEKVGRLLRSLARNVSTYASASSLRADTGGADGPIREDTVREYLDALERLMVIEDLGAWAPHLRSKAVLRSRRKRLFADPSLAVAALRASPESILRDLKLMGFLFESLVIRDLRVYAQHSDAEVLQYRDSNGLEVDAIVSCADGRWAAFEVKLGSGQIDEGAASLRRFVERVDTATNGPPAALGVIVGTGYGYVRADGVAVIPVGTLGP